MNLDMKTVKLELESILDQANRASNPESSRLILFREIQKMVDSYSETLSLPAHLHTGAKDNTVIGPGGVALSEDEELDDFDTYGGLPRHRSKYGKRKMKKEHKQLILHSLGLDNVGFSRNKEPYRNCYCANIDDPKLTEMVQLGLMVAGETINQGKHQYFYVTPKGAELAKTTLPKD